MLKNSLFIVIFFLLNACMKDGRSVSNGEVSDNSLDEQHGNVQVKEINGVKVVLTYKSTEEMAALEYNNNDTVQYKKDLLLEKYSKYLYFTLSYSKDGKELLSTISDSRQHFNQVQDILTFKMNNYVTLLHGVKDTINLVDYNFTRTYGMSRSSTMLFVFDRTKLAKPTKTLHFKVKDIEIGIGDLSYSIPVSLIKNKTF